MVIQKPLSHEFILNIFPPRYRHNKNLLSYDYKSGLLLYLHEIKVVIRLLETSSQTSLAYFRIEEATILTSHKELFTQIA